MKQHNGFQLDPIYDAQQRLVQPASHFKYIGQLAIRNICKHDSEHNEAQIASDFKDFIRRKLSLLGPNFIVSLLPGGTRSKIAFLAYQSNLNNLNALKLDRICFRGIPLKVAPNGYTNEEFTDISNNVQPRFDTQREQVKLLNLELYPVRNNDLTWNKDISHDVLIIDEEVELDPPPIIEDANLILNNNATKRREPSPPVLKKVNNQSINWDHNQWYLGSEDYRSRSRSPRSQYSTSKTSYSGHSQRSRRSQRQKYHQRQERRYFNSTRSSKSPNLSSSYAKIKIPDSATFEKKLEKCPQLADKIGLKSSSISEAQLSSALKMALSTEALPTTSSAVLTTTTTPGPNADPEPASSSKVPVLKAINATTTSNVSTTTHKTKTSESMAAKTTTSTTSVIQSNIQLNVLPASPRIVTVETQTELTMEMLDKLAVLVKLL